MEAASPVGLEIAHTAARAGAPVVHCGISPKLAKCQTDLAGFIAPNPARGKDCGAGTPRARKTFAPTPI